MVYYTKKTTWLRNKISTFFFTRVKDMKDSGE